MNKLILVFIFALSFCAAALAQPNFTDNTFVITTYYPAPHGVYLSLRLHPSDQPTNGVEPGVMYYNQTENVIKFFNGTTWVNMSTVTVQQNSANTLLCRPPGYDYDVLCTRLSNGTILYLLASSP